MGKRIEDVEKDAAARRNLWESCPKVLTNSETKLAALSAYRESPGASSMQ
jgi:hypothetical protein